MTFKPVLVVVLLISLVWALLTLPALGHMFAMVAVLMTVPLWGYVVLIAADMVSAWARPAPYLQSFYRTVGPDLRLAVGNGLVTASIYHFSTAAYGPSAFDIAAAGASFALMTMLNVVDMARAKVAGRPMKRGYILTVVTLTLAGYGYIYATILKIASNHFGLWGSTWLQLTIVFIALFGYVETRRVLFVIQTDHFELSPFLLSVFGPNGSYGQLQAAAMQWNARAASDKAATAQAAHVQRSGKSTVKKRRTNRRR